MSESYLYSKITQLEHLIACLNRKIDDIECTTPCSPPSITSLTSDLILTDGDDFTLTVSATSDSPLTYQWVQDGVDRDGATSYTLSILGAEIGEYVFSVRVTNQCGTVTSSSVGVTVNAIVLPEVSVFTWFGSSDPFTALQTSDDLTWTEILINHNDPILADFREASEAGLLWYAVKEPDDEDLKVAWINTGFNYGPIPDQAWREAFTTDYNSFRYYVTRTDIGLFPEELTALLSEEDELNNTPI